MRYVIAAVVACLVVGAGFGFGRHLKRAFIEDFRQSLRTAKAEGKLRKDPISFITAVIIAVPVALAIVAWIFQRVNRKQSSKAPDDDCIARGAKYFCQIDRYGRSRTGKLWDEHGVVRWRYRPRRNRPVWRSPFTVDFVIADADGLTETVIRRTSLIPPVFQLMDGNSILGRIRTLSVFGKYAIEIDAKNHWTFLTPTFTLWFTGDSASGTDIWVTVGPSKMEWSILIRPGISDRPLVAALAFIHNHKWNYAV